MLILKSDKDIVQLYNETSDEVCVELIEYHSHQTRLWCEYMFNILKKYPKLIIHDGVHDHSTVYLFKDDSCFGLEYLTDDKLIEALDKYKDEFIILDDIVSRDSVLTTVDLYHVEDYLEYNKLKPLLRKLIIDNFLLQL